VKRELAELPVYYAEIKIEVGGRPVLKVNAYDYIDVKFKVGRQPGSGFCTLPNYPFPKAETIYLVMTASDSLWNFQKVSIPLLRSNSLMKSTSTSERSPCVWVTPAWSRFPCSS
jgi:hypothetical protein